VCASLTAIGSARAIREIRAFAHLQSVHKHAQFWERHEEFEDHASAQQNVDRGQTRVIHLELNECSQAPAA